MKKKIVIVFFGPISHNKKLLHLSNLHNEIVQEFAKQGNLSQVYCKDYSEIPNVENVNFKQYSGTVFSYSATIVHKLLRIIPGYTNRLIHEYFFDLFVRKHINYQDTDIIFILRASNLGLCLEAKKRNIDIVGITGIYPMNYLANIINVEAQKMKIKERSEYTSLKRIKMFNSIVETWDKVISLSASPKTKKILENSSFGYKTFVTKTEHDVDKEIFYPSRINTTNEKIEFLAIVDDTFKKGIHILLEAWEKSQSKIGNKAILKIAGNISKNTAPVLKMFDLTNIQFIGYTDEIEKHFRSSDVFISSSIIDLGPRAIKQALCCGVPVIASNNCGMSAFIKHNDEGLIYNDNSAIDLSKNIIFAVENPEILKNFKAKSIEKSKIFNNKLYASEVYNIVNKLSQ